jgi:hypothetical protein
MNGLLAVGPVVQAAPTGLTVERGPRGVRMNVVAGRYDESPSSKSWNHACKMCFAGSATWIIGSAPLYIGRVVQVTRTMLTVRSVTRGVRMNVVAGRYDESPSSKSWNHANLHSLACWVPDLDYWLSSVVHR